MPSVYSTVPAEWVGFYWLILQRKTLFQKNGGHVYETNLHKVVRFQFWSFAGFDSDVFAIILLSIFTEC